MLAQEQEPFNAASQHLGIGPDPNFPDGRGSLESVAGVILRLCFEQLRFEDFKAGGRRAATAFGAEPVRY